MNRLVGQLLQVSRLQATTLSLDEAVDLNSLAAKVVAYLAPLAIARGRSLALNRTATPVLVQASVMALEDSLRNMVENAMTHTPPGMEFTYIARAVAGVAAADPGSMLARAWQVGYSERFFA